MNKFILLITLNYIKNFFKERNNSVPGRISIFSIAVSVFSLIIVLSVMKGFEVKVKDKILRSFPHIIIKTEEDLNLKNIEGIKSTERTSEDYAALLARNNFNLIQVKGFEDSADPLMNIARIRKDYYPILIGKDFAIKFGLQKNSKIEIMAANFSNKKLDIKKVKLYIAAIDDSKLGQIDRIYINNKHKDLLGLTRGTFIEINLEEPYRSKEISKQIVLAYPSLKFKVIDWQTMNSSFFSLMKLERLSISMFLMFLIILSATNIYSNIVSFIVEKKNEIGTLTLLGASKKNLVTVFTLVGLFLGLVGTLIGCILSGITIYIIINTGVVDSLAIDISFYQIEGFPILYSIEYFIYISLFSLIAVLLSSFIPSYLILNKDLESLIRRKY
ncbi:ABC transporter permease [bacterium]|jgi:lipoprotein-releasing system permease protein|nr:ABC transporter permease [bacterium]MBT3795200.1 ABC transporter permease [bacterium]